MDKETQHLLYSSPSRMRKILKWSVAAFLIFLMLAVFAYGGVVYGFNAGAEHGAKVGFQVGAYYGQNACKMQKNDSFNRGNI